MANSLSELTVIPLEQIALDLPLKDLGRVAQTNRYLRAHVTQLLSGFAPPKQFAATIAIFNNMLPVLQGQGLCSRTAYRFQDLTLRELKRIITLIKQHPSDKHSLCTLFRNICIASNPTFVPSCFAHHPLVVKAVYHSLPEPSQKQFLATHQNLFAQTNPIKSLTLTQEEQDLLNVLRSAPFLAIIRDGRAFEKASPEVKNNPVTALPAVSQDGLALEFGTPDIQNNFDITLPAVSQNGGALCYAGPDMKNNITIALTAISNNPGAFEFASDLLRNNFIVTLAAVSRDGETLFHAGADMKNNHIIALTAVSQNPEAFAFVSPQMQADPQIRAAAGLA